MTVKQLEVPQQRTVIDLTNIPYFPPQAQPLTLKEASGLERVREAEAEITLPTYRSDRKPGPVDPSMKFGGIGLAAVMDVSAHPVRAQLRRINLTVLMAVTLVASVATIMLTMVHSLRP